jgi:hypothetical protein
LFEADSGVLARAAGKAGASCIARERKTATEHAATTTIK